jgi:cysteine desulfurase/selenocysteine lyase
MDWAAIRRDEFPVARKWAYFDHAAVAPLPRRSGDALRRWVDGQEGDAVVLWTHWQQHLEETRLRAARLIHADPGEVAFVASTTLGIGLVAEGFPWRDGDSVVSAADEYPSNVFPWMNLASRGVALRKVAARDGRIWPEDIEAAIDGTTRVLAISFVEFSTGFRNDLDVLSEICRRRGVALMVDAIQGLGPLTLDVGRTPVDFLSADGHKWLLGPEGAGILYVRREWIDRLRCLGTLGGHSVVDAHTYSGDNFVLKPDARRWEGGCYNMGGIQALGQSLALFEEIGPATVSARILDRADAVRELARSRGWTVFGSSRPADRAGIVSLSKPGVDPEAIVRHGRETGVVVSCRSGRLRVSPHIYNDDDDLGRLAELLGR